MNMIRRPVPDLDDLSPEQIAQLSPQTLVAIQNDLAARKDALAAHGAKLKAALALRFGGEIAGQYLAKDGGPYGTVNVTGDGFTVKADAKKTVVWNQSMLARLQAELKASGEDPAGYIKVELSVAESAFKAWPPTLKKMFEPARTVKASDPVITIELES